MKIEHEYTKNIVCPYCGYEEHDSWEFQGECGETECGECGKIFIWSRNVEIDYSTRFHCEKNNEEHQWDEWRYVEWDEKMQIGDYYFRVCDRCEKHESIDNITDTVQQ